MINHLGKIIRTLLLFKITYISNKIEMVILSNYYYFIFFNYILLFYLMFNKYEYNFFIFNLIWGLGIGDWGLGIGDWGLGPIPNPQSPIPNPQSPLLLIITKNLKKNLFNKCYNFYS